MKFFKINSKKKKKKEEKIRTEFPKTRQELFKELEMPDNEESNKALSNLMKEGLVEKSDRGYCITNPRGVKVIEKIIKEKKEGG